MIQNRYFYDDLGQLIREDNRAVNRTLVWDYDNAGNITRKRTWSFKLTDATAADDYAALGTPTYNYSYTYGNDECG